MLAGPTAIVSRGPTGIGRAIAAEDVNQGAEIVIASRGREQGEATAEELGCTRHRCDVEEYDKVEALVRATVDEHDRLDVKVNNAGIAS